MTYKEKTYLLDSIERIEKKVDENNKMLKSIIKVMNYYILNLFTNLIKRGAY